MAATPLVVHACLESNPHNDMGTALALYFQESVVIDLETVKLASRDAKCKKLGLSAGEDMTESDFEVVPTPVSELARLTRVLVYNIG